MKRLLLLVILLIPALPISAQLLTRPEIESALGSKPSYSRAEVVELVYQYGVIFDEELIKAKAELQAQAEARQRQWQAAWDAGIGVAHRELAVVWIADAVIGLGLVVYGIYRGDLPVIATGVVMSGAGVVRLVIALK